MSNTSKTKTPPPSGSPPPRRPMRKRIRLIRGAMKVAGVGVLLTFWLPVAGLIYLNMLVKPKGKS